MVPMLNVLLVFFTALVECILDEEIIKSQSLRQLRCRAALLFCDFIKYFLCLPLVCQNKDALALSVIDRTKEGCGMKVIIRWIILKMT